MSTRRFAVILCVDVVGYSRLMQRDSAGLVAELNAIFRGTVRPAVAAAHGRIVKLMGDGALIEFASAFDGLSCAVQIQRAMAQQKSKFVQPIRLRIGLHAGDVLVEGDDLFGECVNIAQRLQAAAEPGGILLSGTVAELAGGDLPVRLRSEGRRTFRNIDRPLQTFSADLSAEVRVDPAGARPLQQEIRFCRAADGVSLAWAETGSGPTVVKAPNWITHLELDWRGLRSRTWLSSLSARCRLVRYDARGNGLSSRDVAEISFERFVDDLECVFDAAGIERAPIFALSQGCAIAIAFAARAPERVSGLVLTGGFSQGRAQRRTAKGRAELDAMKAMIDVDWDGPYPSLRDLLAERIIPLASIEDRRQFAEDMRQMTSGETMMRYREVIDNIDITHLLAEIRAPCLVLHCTRDRMQPVEQGQALASGIPNARFIAYDSPNHVFTENDPCWPEAERDIHAFLAEVTAIGEPAGDARPAAT